MTQPRLERHPLRNLAVRLLDQWAQETDPALDDLAADGRPQSAWDNVRIGLAKSGATAKRKGRPRMIGGPDGTPVGAPTLRVNATATRAPGTSRPPAGATGLELSPESKLTAGLMVLVADIDPLYARAVWATHLLGTEAAAGEALEWSRDQMRRRYETGFALFVRELVSVVRSTPRGLRVTPQERAAAGQCLTTN